LNGGLIRLTRGCSWIWGSRYTVSQRRSSPCGLFSRAEGKLKLSDDVILLDTPFMWSYGVCQQQI
jgi:hypothetical protein